MGGSSVSNVLIGFILMSLFCTICSLCSVSSVYGTIYAGMLNFANYLQSMPPTQENINNPETIPYTGSDPYYIVYPDQSPNPSSNPTSNPTDTIEDNQPPTLEYEPENTENDIPVSVNDPVNNKFYLISGSINNSMRRGDYILSPNNLYKLLFQMNGNLVLYDLTSPSGTPVSIWSSKTMNTRSNRVTLENTGYLEINFVDGNKTKNIWTSVNNRNINNQTGPYKLVLQNDRNLVIYDANLNIMWSSNTALTAPEINEPPVNNTAEEYAPVNTPETNPESMPESMPETYYNYLASDSTTNNVLNIGSKLVSLNGKYALNFNTNNTVTLNPTNNPIQIIWKISGKYASKLTLMPSGNLVLTNTKDILWQSNTKNIGKAPYEFVLLDDRNLVIRDSTKYVIWKSDTRI